MASGAVSGSSSGAVILEVGDSGLCDWSAHRRSLLGKCGSEFEAIMQRCLSMHESRIVLLEKEPTAVKAHMCMNTARMMLLSDMGDAAEALETILLRNRDDVDSAGEVACFLSTIRRSQENACREYGVETVGTVATAATTVGGRASFVTSGGPTAWSSTFALGRDPGRRDPGRSVLYDGFSTPIVGGLAAAAQAARGDGTRRGTAPPARQCARRFFGQPFGAGEAEPRFGENGWRDDDGGDGDGGGGGVGEEGGGRPAAIGGSTAWAPKKKKRIEKEATKKEREVDVSGESNNVVPHDTSTDDGVRGGAGGRVARPLSPGYVLLYHTRTNT
jgi:hypothetical protein